MLRLWHVDLPGRSEAISMYDPSLFPSPRFSSISPPLKSYPRTTLSRRSQPDIVAYDLYLHVAAHTSSRLDEALHEILAFSHDPFGRLLPRGRVVVVFKVCPAEDEVRVGAGTGDDVCWFG